MGVCSSSSFRRSYHRPFVIGGVHTACHPGGSEVYLLFYPMKIFVKLITGKNFGVLGFEFYFIEVRLG